MARQHRKDSAKDRDGHGGAGFRAAARAPPRTGIAPTALARRLVAEGRRGEAEAVVARLVADNFRLDVASVTITADWSSLNSLNGLVDTADGRRFFFKFHQEEGEEGTVEEYYRAELLQRAGLPVDMPAMMSRKPGHQILLYAFRRDRQLAAACLDIERSGDERDVARLLRLQDGTRPPDRRGLPRDPARGFRGGEPGRGDPPALPQPALRPAATRPASPAGSPASISAAPWSCRALTLPWADFAALRWRINGIDYADTLAGLFDASLVRLAPDRLAGGAVTAHGDAHNANVWIEERDGDARLVMFDPAFAGEHVPALLADVKATFHNVFAHPFWLYHPDEADRRFSVDGLRRRTGASSSTTTGT